ncbi:MAG TPA: tetratricopeptide repeat protein [Anaerolineae bacterium]|nr:tetratricopeptide repeat protein [Anaerolineae bacterium]
MSSKTVSTRSLVPAFIEQRQAEGKLSGQLVGTAVFVDIAGFTHITETLLGHNRDAAETLAQLMTDVLTPLIKIVYSHQGFVTQFAGDAFTALFPTPHKAFTASQQMQRYARYQARYQTAHHEFVIGLKIGIGSGDIYWGIFEPEEMGAEGSSLAAAYYFSGGAIRQAAMAQKRAEAGQVVVDQKSYERLLDVLTAVAVDKWWLVDIVTAPLNFETGPIERPVEGATDSPFIPETVLEQTHVGEYRQVYSLFINLPELSHHTQLATFMALIFRLQGQYGGYLSGLHYDDKGWHVILFWGMPLSYENDAEQLSQFVLELQAESELVLRVGMTYRLMYAGFLGALGWREAYSCYGRGANLAARLMTTAPWGEVWLDGLVAQQISRYGELLPRGKRLFKGFEHKQAVYQLVGLRDEVHSLFSEVFVGRQTELMTLASLLTPLKQKQGAGIVLLRGGAGMGKSRLLHKFKEQYDWGQQLTIQAEQALHPHGLNPWRGFLLRYFEQSSQQDPMTNQQQFIYRFYQLLATVVDHRLRQRLQEGESHIAAMLNLPTEGTAYARMDGQERYEKRLLAIESLLLAESKREPLLLFIEDAHWLDGESWALLRRLAQVDRSYPLGIVVTGRPESEVDKLVVELDLPVIDLPPLSEASLAGLATRILDVPPAPDLLQIIVKRSGGNPFFAEQMLFYLYQLGDDVSAQELRRTTSLLPLDVRAPLIARLDRLPTPVKLVVQAAAILGYVFDVSVLLNMFSEDPYLHEKVQEAEMASVWTAVDHVKYRFTHELLRDAAYEMQLKTERQDIHLRAAQAIELIYEAHLAPHYAQLAYHYEKAEKLVKACVYWEKAGHIAQDAYQNKDALAYYERFLDLIERLTTESEMARQTFEWKKIEVWQRQGVLLRHIGQAHLAEVKYELALALARRYEDNEQIASIQLDMGYLLHHFGRKEEALFHYQQALSFYEGKRDTMGQAKVQSRLGVLYAEQGDYGQAVDYFEASWALAYKLEDHTLVAKNLNNLALVYQRQGQYDEALSYLKQGLQIKRILGDEESLARTLSNIAIIYGEKGAYQQALEYLEEALEIDRKLGRRSGIAKRLHNMGVLYTTQGDYPQALAAYQEALSINRALGYERSLGRNLAWIGNLYNVQGQYELALTQLVQAEEILREVNDTYGLAHCLVAMAQVYFYQRDFRQAQRLLAEGMTMAESTGVAEVVFDGELLQAQIQAYQGHKKMAVERLEAHLVVVTDDRKRVELLYLLWEMTRRADYGLKAEHLYEQLMFSMPTTVYQQNWRQLRQWREERSIK